MLEDRPISEIEEKWKEVKGFFTEKFTDGERVSIETILYLVGVRELGKNQRKFEKDEKIDLMHMATCKLLEPFGYFKLDFVDPDGWSHYKQMKDMPDFKKMEQYQLLQRALVFYFEENVWN